MAGAWWLYIVGCADGTLYTGVTTDVQRRFSEHCAGGKQAARYCKGRDPLQLLFYREIGARSLALRIEARLKKLPRGEKFKIINEDGRWQEFIGSSGIEISAK